MYDYRRYGGGLLGAFLLGGAVGAILGLLFSPRSGRENREMLSQKVEEYWGEGKDFYETSRGRIAEVYESGKEKAGETAAEMREKIDAARDRLREQVDTVSTQAKSKVAEVSKEAKEPVSKAAEAVKGGVTTAEKKVQETLDKLSDLGEEAAPAEGAKS